MPYYGRTSDPGDYYTGGQDQNFDPMTGRLLGGQLFMQFMNQLQSLKDQERKRKWEIEDRDLNKRLIEARIKDYEEANRAVPQETPEEKHRREMDKLAKQHEFRLKEIEAGNKGKTTSTTGTTTPAQKTESEFDKAMTKIDNAYQSEIGKATRGYGLGKSQAMVNYMSLGYKTPQEAGTAYDANYQKSVTNLKEARDLQIDSLLESYSELPSAQLLKKKRELEKSNTPTPAPKISGKEWMAGKKSVKEAREKGSVQSYSKIAVDPKTGKKVGWNGKEWVLIQ